MVALCLPGTLPFFSKRIRIGDECGGAIVCKFSGVKAYEAAPETEAAKRLRNPGALLQLWIAGEDVDVARCCSHVRRIDIHRALSDRELAKIFSVGVFLGIHREIARVVDWNSVNREAELIRIEPAHLQSTTKHTGWIVAECAHARQQVDKLKWI